MPDARVDDGDDDGFFGQVLDRSHEQERSGANVVGGDVVRKVDDPHVGRDAEHDRLAHADELVGMAVVGREGDDHQRGYAQAYAIAERA